MGNYTANVVWSLREGDDFLNGRYSRGHAVSFDGGVVIPGSASPHVVGKWADPAAVDPEEMLVAALSTCHMLTFLHLARLAGFAVAGYRDQAEGVMEEVAPGKLVVARVQLRPQIDWAGPAPGEEVLRCLHHEAHEGCFIANSVRTQVSVL